MKRQFPLLLAAMCAFSATLSAQGTKYTTEQYIDKYKDLAIKAMIEYNIPASITMGQAILESSSGNSPLSIKSNNHFGIKCKPEWKGETVLHDDDAKNECFRKYSSVEASFHDHSLFLAQRDRYSSLFSLDIMNYNAWAEGLKSAGYATSPVYATKLVKIIEDNKLYELDDIAMGATPTQKQEVGPKADIKPSKPVEYNTAEVYNHPKFDVRDYTLYKKDVMDVYKNNKVRFVVAGEGETLQTISNKLGISLSRLMKYNDFETEPKTIGEGAIIYIRSKKRKAANGYKVHYVAKGETLHAVSQQFGIKIEKLAKRNLYTKHYVIKQGQKMLLR